MDLPDASKRPHRGRAHIWSHGHLPPARPCPGVAPITVERRLVLRTTCGCSWEGDLRPQASFPVDPALPHPTEPTAKARL